MILDDKQYYAKLRMCSIGHYESLVALLEYRKLQKLNICNMLSEIDRISKNKDILVLTEKIREML
jgi:hypothetical protein